jgi:hypothetical protein
MCNWKDLPMTTTQPSTPERAPTQVRRRRLLTLAGATLAPTLLWLLAKATGTELEVTVGGQPPMVITLPLVIAAALGASLAGWAALAVLRRVTGRGRVVWTARAVLALLLSLGPLATADTSPAARTYLVLMHVAVAAVLIPGLRGTVTTRSGS